MLINAYCTHRNPPRLEFQHTLRGRRDRSDPELGPHIDGFMGFIMDRGKRPMTQMRYAVLRHLERVQHHLALEVEDIRHGGLADWATCANAILFFPDGTVRAPDGRVLVNPETGDPEPNAKAPYPKDAVERKAATNAKLAELGIRGPASLPPVVSEIEVELQPASLVASRCLALLACALRAESLASGQALSAKEIREKLPGAFEAMSPIEKDFFKRERPEQQAITNHGWRYEALAALFWALNGFELPFPNQIANVADLAKRLFDLDTKVFVANAQLRDVREILDALDLHVRLHWAVREARLNQKAPPPNVEVGVVVERHHALNWLTGFERADWDDVKTPT